MIFISNRKYSYCSVRNKIWVEMIQKFYCSVRNKIWVERQMPNLLRAVGTPYEMSDILRTYGTLYARYPIFYPYNIPNGMIF